MFMKTAYFEIIHEDYKDDGNPYSAVLLPDEKIPDKPDPKRIRRLRNWLIALTFAVVGFTILGYIMIRLYSPAEAAGLQERMKMLTMLNGILIGVAVIISLALLVVVYRLSRALGNSRIMSMLYLVFSTTTIGGGEQTPTAWVFLVIPIGCVIIPFILYIQAQNALFEQPDETDSY